MNVIGVRNRFGEQKVKTYDKDGDNADKLFADSCSEREGCVKSKSGDNTCENDKGLKQKLPKRSVSEYRPRIRVCTHLYCSLIPCSRPR